MTLKEKANRLKQDIPALFLCLNDPGTPLAAKIPAALTTAYALSPIDLVPDSIPVLDCLDGVLLPPAGGLEAPSGQADAEFIKPQRKSRKNSGSVPADSKRSALMDNLNAARKAIASTLHKEEKALETLKSKNARRWQIDRLTADVKNHRAMLALIESTPVVQEEVEAAMAAIPGYIEKIQKILPKFQEGTPQHTLAVRRIAAYETAAGLARCAKEDIP